MKTLTFSQDSPTTTKVGDTETTFTLVLGESETSVDLTKAKSISIKLGNVDGYLGSSEYPVSSISTDNPSQVELKTNDSIFNGLSANVYLLEVWVEYTDPSDTTGAKTLTSIYPSEETLQFGLNQNLVGDAE